jgi:hypothetical protein
MRSYFHGAKAREAVMGRDCDLWLWDGRSEYEGLLGRCEAGDFTARVRVRREPGATLLGRRRTTASTMDLHRLFTQRRFLAHPEVPGFPPLLEACVTGVQVCGDGAFDFLLVGRLACLPPEELERLSVLPPARAAELMQKRVG